MEHNTSTQTHSTLPSGGEQAACSFRPADRLASIQEYYFSRKLKVDIFIDDRNIGGLPDWGTMYRIISHHLSLTDIIRERMGESMSHEQPKKKHWWQF